MPPAMPNGFSPKRLPNTFAGHVRILPAAAVPVLLAESFQEEINQAD